MFQNQLSFIWLTSSQFQVYLFSISVLPVCHSSAPDPAWGAQLHPAYVSAEAAFPRRPRGLPPPLRPYQQPTTQDPPGRGPEREGETERWWRQGGDGDEADSVTQQEEVKGGADPVSFLELRAPGVPAVQAAAVLVLPDHMHLWPGRLSHPDSWSWNFCDTLPFGWQRMKYQSVHAGNGQSVIYTGAMAAKKKKGVWVCVRLCACAVCCWGCALPFVTVVKPGIYQHQGVFS